MSLFNGQKAYGPRRDRAYCWMLKTKVTDASVSESFLYHCQFWHIVYEKLKKRKEKKKWQNYILDTEQWAVLKQQMH